MGLTITWLEIVMKYLSLSPVIGLSIVGMGQVVITIPVLVVLMKEIIDHLITEVIMNLKVHTALIIEVIEVLNAEIIVILEVIIVLFIKVLRTEILAIMIITSQIVVVGLVVLLICTNLHTLKRREGLSV